MQRVDEKEQDFGNHIREVHEILGNPPKKILTWGLSLIFSFLLLILIGTWFFKYPDVINTQIVIDADSLKTDLIAHITGRISKTYVKNNSYVKVNQSIAHIESSEVFNKVQKLKEITSRIKLDDSATCLSNYCIYDTSNSIREICSTFLSIKLRLEEYYKYFRKNVNCKKYNNSQEINTVCLQIITQLEHHLTLQKNILSSCLVKLHYDSLQFLNGQISSIELNQSLLNYLQNQSIVDDLKEKVLFFKLYELKSVTSVIAFDSVVENRKKWYKSTINRDVEILNSKISEWERKHNVITDRNGEVTYSHNIKIGSHITEGQLIATVISNPCFAITGTIIIPMTNSGKVKRGQRVNIKLSNYPYLEYGIIYGIINEIKYNNKDMTYLGVVKFPHGLVSSYGKRISILPKMIGSAEIITDDIRLIQRLLFPLRSLFNGI